MEEKIQLIPSQSFYVEGDYTLNIMSPHMLQVKLPTCLLKLEAENIEIEFMYKRALYVTFDQMKKVQLITS